MNKDKILALIQEYIVEKHAKQTWTAGKDWVQYSAPYFDSLEYVAAVSSLLDEWLVLGDKAIQFEKEFPSIVGKNYGIVTNSGSSSNLLMVAALMDSYDLKSGDKVIVPVAGFPTTLNPILHYGLTPIFIDIELQTLNLDLDQLEKAAKAGAKALMFAHVLGNPPNMDRVMSIVRQYNLLLLEDCCDALGSTYDNKPLGSFGIFTSCSFYPAHHITMGEGGFVACNTKREERVLRSFRDWGRGCFCVGKEANLLSSGSCGCRFKAWIPEIPDEIFDHKYVYQKIGYNLKPIELQCAMILEQMKKIPTICSKRRDNYLSLSDIFSPYEEFFILPRATDKSNPAWFAYPITVKNNNKFKKSDFTLFFEDKKIQTRNYFGGNLLLQPAYRKYSSPSSKIDFPVATKVTTDTFFLGTSPVITQEQMEYVKSTVRDFFNK